MAGSHCRIRELLQSPDATGFEAFGQLEARLRDWYASTLGLLGAHYLQVVEHLFKENRLATGRFVALGRRVDLSELRCLLFLLAARDDDVVAPEQIFATERLISCKPRALEKTVAPGDIPACSWVRRLLRIPGRISLAGFRTERRRS